MRTIRFYDAREREVRPFEPREDGKVGIYACGPTVYSRVHVGNARPFVVFSLLKRYLEHEGYEVTFVANITDINDKIYNAARAAGRDSADLAREMTAHYIGDTERLGLGRPDHEPLASEYVAQIIDLIGALMERGHAYAADGDVYFRVRTQPDYGALSRRDVDQMDQGAGVRAGTSSARRWPRRCSASSSTSTAAASTSCSRTTRTRWRRRRRVAAARSRGCG